MEPLFKYPPSFFMADFIASDQQKQFIWVANKTDGNLRQMIFTKLGNRKNYHSKQRLRVHQN